MSNYELIALDMDGTLLNSQKKISKQTITAIKKATALNKYVVLSTGRGLAELKDYENEIYDIQYGVLESGALVYDLKNRKIIHQEYIPFNIVDKIMAIANQSDIMVHLFNNGSSIVSKKNLHEMAKYQMEIYQPMFQRVTTTVDDIYSFSKDKMIEKINLITQTKKHAKKVINY